MSCGLKWGDTMPKNKLTREDALQFHMQPTPGKWEIQATVPMTTQRDLSLAYSPGVAIPCEEIAANPALAYDYTNKGNLVAVISNGTAVLGLGNLGALGSKPVMEGKSVLFKRFADVNSVDIELDTEDPEEFIKAVRLMGPTFGGINLEDIKAPECFIIEQTLKEQMDIPVTAWVLRGSQKFYAAWRFYGAEPPAVPRDMDIPDAVYLRTESR